MKLNEVLKELNKIFKKQLNEIDCRLEERVSICANELHYRIVVCDYKYCEPIFFKKIVSKDKMIDFEKELEKININEEQFKEIQGAFLVAFALFEKDKEK